MATNDAILEDDIEVGGRPGSVDAGVPPTPGDQIAARAQAGRHYVAADRAQWYTTLPRALPWALDDVSHDFGQDIYDRMLLDAQVRGTVNVLKAAILDQGISLTSPIKMSTDDGYDKAKTLCDQAERMLDDLETPLQDVLWDMLDALPLGNRVAELTFDIDSTLSGSQQWRLTHISPKPRESLAFVVDAYMNTLGLMARVPGQPMNVQQGLLLVDLATAPNFLPRSKFAVLTSRPRNNDPRGTSAIRAAFDPWNQKQQIKREHLKYLSQFATPSLIGFTAEAAQPYPVLNPDGSEKTDGSGNVVMQTPEQDMLAALEAFANGSATAFPFGANVKPVEVSGDGEAFLAAFDLFDRQITKAILNQTLATEESSSQGRAASSTHKDVLDQLTRMQKRPAARMVERDVIWTWMRLGDARADRKLAPRVALGQMSQEDISRLWSGVGRLQAASYLHQSQYEALDALVGLPPRTPPDAVTLPITETIGVKTTSPVGGADGETGDDESDDQNGGGGSAASGTTPTNRPRAQD